MSASGKRPSRRFQSSSWSEWLVPVILVLLLLVLIGTILYVLLFSLGVVPAL